MKNKHAFLAIPFLCLLFCINSKAEDAKLIYKLSAVGNNYGDICKYRVRGETHGSKPLTSTAQTISASVGVNWSLSSIAGNASGSGGASASGENSAEATFVGNYDIPTYADWTVTWVGTHIVSGGTSFIQANTSGQNWLDLCNLVAGPDEPICSQLLVKQGAGPECDGSPLIVDLLGDGFRLGKPGDTVSFDLKGNGVAREMQWVAPDRDEGFVFQDLNGNGICDDGSELFGVGSRMLLEVERLTPNGFVALAQYDDRRLGGNYDGFITDEDEIWGRLHLWIDANADGGSTLDEIHELGWWDLAKFELYPKNENLIGPFGNWFRYWAKTYGTDGTSFDLVDVYFQIVDNDFGN